MTEQKQFFVPRSCIVATQDQNSDTTSHLYTEVKSLSYFRDKGAYILLGDPGAGKTSCFKHESQQQGCYYVKAREFIHDLDIDNSWQDKTLFIDGLDEIRAGSGDSLLPLDAIRKQLLKLGRPRFRLSCREADWLGSSDQQDLEWISPDNTITCLHLNPLDEDDIRKIAQHESPSLPIDKFIHWVKQQGFMQLLGNPQILILMVKAVSGGTWPKTREQAFALACQEIVQEQNRAHQQSGKFKHLALDSLLDSAGKLFAHQLISGMEGYSLSTASEDPVHPYFQRVFSDELEQLESCTKD